MAYSIKFENGQEYPIDGFTLIGRNPDNSILETASIITIDDVTKTLSKTHCAVAINPDGELLIEDLESTNGTFIAGDGEFETQVFNSDPQVLKPGNRVRLGEIYFDVEEK